MEEGGCEPRPPAASIVRVPADLLGLSNTIAADYSAVAADYPLWLQTI